MLPCLVIGDSIAAGIGQQLPQCETVARVGITSWAWLNEHHGVLRDPRDVVVISLGSNDGQEWSGAVLEAIRLQVKARQVIWVLPTNAAKNRQVHDVARERGDLCIGFIPGKDGIHPHSYVPLAKAVKALYA